MCKLGLNLFTLLKDDLTGMPLFVFSLIIQHCFLILQMENEKETSKMAPSKDAGK